jgi:hypothetical protein
VAFSWTSLIVLLARSAKLAGSYSPGQAVIAIDFPTDSGSGKLPGNTFSPLMGLVTQTDNW